MIHISLTKMGNIGKLSISLLFIVLVFGCNDETKQHFKTIKPRQTNWAWIHADTNLSDSALSARLISWQKLGIQGLLIGGYDPRTFKAAKKMGFETHLWMWTLNRGDSVLLAEHADWYAVSRSGKSCVTHPPYVSYYRWLCPTKITVQNYLKSEVDRLCKLEYVDGIHLDYIRFCDVILPRALWEKYGLIQDRELPSYDFCYCDSCLHKFGEQGVVLDTSRVEMNDAWRQFRFDAVTHLVNDLAEVVHSNNKLISAAVFPSPDIAKKLVRQDWVNWDLDMVYPMTYNKFYNENLDWIGNCIRDGKKKVNIPVFAGLYMPDLLTDKELMQATKQALKGGADGISIFGEVNKKQAKYFVHYIDAAFRD